MAFDPFKTKSKKQKGVIQVESRITLLLIKSQDNYNEIISLVSVQGLTVYVSEIGSFQN